jgi:hypothetical protein
MIIAVAAAVAVTFPGGDWSELCRSISENTEKNVVALAGNICPAPKFEYEPSDLNAMTRSIRAATLFRQAPGTDAIFYRDPWPVWLFQNEAIRRMGELNADIKTGGPLPENAVSEGKMTLRHEPRQATSVSAFGPVLSKPLQLHWALEGLAVKAWVKDQPATDFMRFVAKAVGGILLERKDRFVLEIDPKEVQRRALATFDEAAKRSWFKDLDERARVEWELSRSAVSWASTAQIQEALAEPDSKTKILIGHGLRPVVKKQVEHLFRAPAEVADEGANARSRTPADSRDRYRNLDPRLIGYVELNAQFHARTYLQTVDVQGRPGPVIALP